MLYPVNFTKIPQKLPLYYIQRYRSLQLIVLKNLVSLLYT